MSDPIKYIQSNSWQINDETFVVVHLYETCWAMDPELPVHMLDGQPEMLDLQGNVVWRPVLLTCCSCRARRTRLEMHDVPNSPTFVPTSPTYEPTAPEGEEQEPPMESQ